MKKIYCDMNTADFLAVEPLSDGIFIISTEEGKVVQINLSPTKIRKLRKQLKKALLQIEGNDAKSDEDRDEWKAGDKVFLIHGPDEGSVWKNSPTTDGMDMSKPVELLSKDEDNRWTLRYTDTEGEEVEGFASEHSFGDRVA